MATASRDVGFARMVALHTTQPFLHGRKDNWDPMYADNKS